MTPPRRRFRPCLVLTVALTAGGCVLSPAGEQAERDRLAAAAPSFEAPIEARRLPALPEPAGWRDVLRRAFLANGALEASYFAWKAALAEIDRAATWPNSNLTFGFSYMFSPGNMKAWDRTTLAAGFDPAMNLTLPEKTAAAAKVALEAARGAGAQFRAAKFALQRKVLLAYFDLALTEEKIRIERENLALLKLTAQSAGDRAEAGAPLQDLLKALVEEEMAESALDGLEDEARSTRSGLNGMLYRDPRAPLRLPPALPPPRSVTDDDARLIAMAVDENPELAALSRQVAGRKDAIELARLAYLPDFSPSLGMTGGLSQTLGAMAMLPTTLPAIRAEIERTEAMAKADEATYRQTRRDRAAAFVADLYLMRSAEARLDLYRRRVIPAARQLLGSSREAYAAGSVGFAELIDSERTLIAVRLQVADLAIAREKRLADLEALAGTDIETLGGKK